jgi:signal transduction histidine kinase/ActR/RegA family two-component response regulator
MSAQPSARRRALPLNVSAPAAIALSALAAVAVVGAGTFAPRSGLAAAGFLPHGVCYRWDPPLMWLHLASDALIGAAYFSIPAALVYFMRRRADLPFSWIFLLFGLFIVACGATHWMEVWTVFEPHYWLAGAVKAVTAAASVPTAVVLAFLIPHALALPSLNDLRQAKDALEAEVAERRRAEEALRHSQAELERRVAERTAELAAANAEAEAANRLKDEFLATVSHELRTPLGSIMSWVHALGTGRLDARAAREAVEKIDRNARAQARLIDDLLDVSRIVSGKLRLEMRPLDAVALVESALETIEPAASAKHIDVRFAIEAGNARVAGDPDRLRQVLWNLLSNAVKFTPAGGHVAVTLRQSGDQVRIAVADDGIGIDAALLPHVFDRFRQAEGRTRHQGLGLGLAIVKHVVEMHGGTVTAESAGPGRGATFVVALPIPAVVKDEEELARPAPPTHAPRLAGVEVLLVDDEPDARESLAEALRLDGARARVSGSVREALAALSASTPDVLISDIGMPDEDGHALIARVREGEGGAARLPAIALTAMARAEDRMRALAAGFDAHVAKPVHPDELALVIVRLLARRAD